MKLENQVVSLELAKKLKGLGVKQESLFHHVWRELDGTPEGQYFIWEKPFEVVSRKDNCFSAFTVAELGEMLPDILKFNKNEYPSFFEFTFDKGSRKYDIRYVHWDNNSYDTDLIIRGESEADARAKMLIYLLENKLITL